jgi:uroporphyrinogen-III decarboxylase
MGFSRQIVQKQRVVKMGKRADVLYEEREKRINDAIQLNVPDRVPVVTHFGFFPAKYSGITYRDAMYDSEKMQEAWAKATIELEPDMYENPYNNRFLGHVLDALDFKQLQWPGNGTDEMSSYQFLEKEYMKGDEYNRFLFDMTDFIVRIYWPRIFGSMASFKSLPPINEIITYYMGFPHLAAFDDPAVINSMESLLKAAKAAKKMISEAANFAEKMEGLGFPPQFGSLTQAPFDTLSDFFRGTKGALLDMYRNREKLLDAVDKLLPVMLNMGLRAKNKTAPRVFIPLHKGIDSFMSEDQFKTFYWPTLQKLITELANEGLAPFVFWEGDCTSRLEIIGEIPPGKVVYWFEQTDIFKAKEVLGDTVCIRGNVPLSMLCAGTPDDVKAYCKKLIDVVGKNGGFIMDSATVIEDAKPENVKTMLDFTKAYGVYR